MYKNLTITSVLGLLGIILGAFGAHTLKNKLSIDAFDSFQTAIRYQMYHVFVLLLINLFNGFSDTQKKILSLIFLSGIFLFSGSIYAICLVKIPAKSIWFITPIGGLFFVAGWLLTTVYFIKKLNSPKFLKN